MASFIAGWAVGRGRGAFALRPALKQLDCLRTVRIHRQTLGTYSQYVGSHSTTLKKYVGHSRVSRESRVEKIKADSR